MDMERLQEEVEQEMEELEAQLNNTEDTSDALLVAKRAMLAQREV